MPRTQCVRCGCHGPPPLRLPIVHLYRCSGHRRDLRAHGADLHNINIKAEAQKSACSKDYGVVPSKREGAQHYLATIKRSLLDLHKRERVFLDQLTKHFAQSEPPKFPLCKCGPRQQEVYQQQFRTAHVNFWNQNPDYPPLPARAPTVLEQILKVGKGKHIPKDTEDKEETERLQQNKAREKRKETEKVASQSATQTSSS